MIAEMKTTIYNDKILDCIAVCVNPKVRQLTLEGTIRSTKTVDGIEGFYWRVFNSKEHTHIVASNDTDTLNNNILEADGFGLLSKFSFNCKMVKDKIGGNYIKMLGADGNEKKIMLATYANRAKWKKVLGGTIENIFIDEANIADPQFINECYARQVSCEHPFTLYTLNGDIPTASIYQHINPSKIIGTAPASIHAEMDKVEKKRGYYYMHFTMWDNPIMTPEKITAASIIYPPDSYYYKIKILGERGTPGKLIYSDYIDESKLLQKIDCFKYHSFTISMDVGATRAQNSITLIGFTYGYTQAAVITKETFPCVGYTEKTKRLISFYMRCINAFGARNIECIIIDSAEQNYINDLAADFRNRQYPDVIGSYKATIKERIDMDILLMSAGKLIFNDTEEGRNALGAFKEATWEEGKEGEVRKDENEPWNDILDSIEYGLTKHMKALLRSFKGNR